jgi:8-oxo-dGTP pyrophosphatase MutT (NUDIX family)
MPLENAKEGTPGLKRNIEREIEAGKPQKQAVAIAYAKARGDAVDVVEQPHIKASGILVVCQGQILLLRRTGGDHEGEWCIPGGKIENGETSLEAAIRETREEAGVEVPAEALVEWTRTIRDGVDFTTFAASITEQPDVSLDETESSECGWFRLDALPEPLHPGMGMVIKRFSMDELDVAQAMSTNELASPSVYQNLALFNIRITGTGLSYRVDHDEYVWRDPSLYLTERFLKRCNGLIVIWEHPEATIVDSAEFANRIVGTVFLPYVPADKPEEVWAVVKMYDDAAINELATHPYSTSPSVTLRKTANATRELDGETLLIEGIPALVDHIALCSHGVWDKGGPPDGVESADIIRADSATGHLHNCAPRVKHNSSLAAGVSFAAAVFVATKGK